LSDIQTSVIYTKLYSSNFVMDNISLPLKILVAVDDSESSRQALLQAFKLINLQAATIVLLSVEEPVMTSFTPNILSPDVFKADVPSRWEDQAAAIKLQEQKTRSAIQGAEHLCEQAGVRYVTRTEFGEPKHAICEVAQQENPDLMVIGSHGYGLVERALIGSVSEYVVHHAQCPVLVVRQLTMLNDTR